MIVVTGGAGFIGSNLVRTLNELGHSRIMIVDHLNSKLKEANLANLHFAEYLDKSEFRTRLASGAFPAEDWEAIYHQGACTSTVEKDWAYLRDNNFEYSRELLDFALARKIPFVYASSAAVYGQGKVFREDPGYEQPLNMYGRSKLMLDSYVRSLVSSAHSAVVGLRYFNVYGRREAHKGRMSSVVHQFSAQLRERGCVHLFRGCDGYADGEQRRDFIHVGDVVQINLFFGTGPARQGIYNVGTGRSRSFNDVAKAVVHHEGYGHIEYVDFPDDLRGAYQSFTQADVSRLRSAGYDRPMKDLEHGVSLTLNGGSTSESERSQPA